MSGQPEALGDRPRRIVDVGVYHNWATALEIVEYLPPGWRQFVADHVRQPWHDFLLGLGPKPAGPLGFGPLGGDFPYQSPHGRYFPGSQEEGAVAGGSSAGSLVDQHLNPNGIDSAILCHGLGMFVPIGVVPRLALELVRAVNDWTVERWLASDDRLRAAVLVPTQIPDAAAEEIRRIGKPPQVVAVLLGANGLGKPFGHPAYFPIYEAAEEMGLPLIIRAGGDSGMEAPSYPTAGGMPGTYTEFRVLGFQSLATHAASLIAQGVVERFKSLKFLLLGAGATWVTPFLWRFDTEYMAFRQGIAWIQNEMPSDVFHRHFFVGTDSSFQPSDPEVFRAVLEADPSLADIICYSSGYPDREYLSPSRLLEVLPHDWGDKVMSANAVRLFGLPSGPTDTASVADTLSSGRLRKVK